MTKFVTFGETLVQYNATYTGPFRKDGPHQEDCAGAESNVAVNLGKLGLPDLQTVWVSRLGADAEGNFVRRELNGRTEVAAAKYDGQRTGISYLNHLDADQHVKTYQRQGSAASRLTFQDVRPHLEDADLLHVTGITPALSDTCRRTVFEAIGYARANGILVSFDLNYRSQLWSPAEARSVIDEMLGYSSLFKLGHDEAEAIWAKGWSPEQYARRFQSEGRVVIVTLGSDGAIAFDGSDLVEQPGYDIEMVDPIGAGDAFVAGFLGGVLERQPLKDFFHTDGPSRDETLRRSLEIANVCGALTCTRRGDTAAMPTMREVREFVGHARARTASSRESTGPSPPTQ